MMVISIRSSNITKYQHMSTNQPIINDHVKVRVVLSCPDNNMLLQPLDHIIALVQVRFHQNPSFPSWEAIPRLAIAFLDCKSFHHYHHHYYQDHADKCGPYLALLAKLIKVHFGAIPIINFKHYNFNH